MRRPEALLLLLAFLLAPHSAAQRESREIRGVPASSEEGSDACKRQPFRGRCPGTGAGGQPQRSQFVLRYYLRNGECVSYPYGKCGCCLQSAGSLA